MSRHKKVTVCVDDIIFNRLLRMLTRRRRPKLLLTSCPIRHVGGIGASFSEFEANGFKVL